MSPFGMRSPWSCCGINLHHGNLCAGILEFFDSLRVLPDFFKRRLIALDGCKQALNHNRTLAAGGQNIGKNFFQFQIGPVHTINELLSPTIKLDPNFIRTRQKLQTTLNSRQIQTSSVGDENNLKKPAQRADANYGLKRFVKILCKRRFAIATQGNVTELEQLGWQRLVI